MENVVGDVKNSRMLRVMFLAMSRLNSGTAGRICWIGQVMSLKLRFGSVRSLKG